MTKNQTTTFLSTFKTTGPRRRPGAAVSYGCILPPVWFSSVHDGMRAVKLQPGSPCPACRRFQVTAVARSRSADSDLTTYYKSPTYVDQWPFRLSDGDDLRSRHGLCASSGVSYRRIRVPYVHPLLYGGPDCLPTYWFYDTESRHAISDDTTRVKLWKMVKHFYIQLLLLLGFTRFCALFTVRTAMSYILFVNVCLSEVR